MLANLNVQKTVIPATLVVDPGVAGGEVPDDGPSPAEPAGPSGAGPP